jgi:hypothetical protein
MDENAREVHKANMAENSKFLMVRTSQGRLIHVEMHGTGLFAYPAFRRKGADAEDAEYAGKRGYVVRANPSRTRIPRPLYPG